MVGFFGIAHLISHRPRFTFRTPLHLRIAHVRSGAPAKCRRIWVGLEFVAGVGRVVAALVEDFTQGTAGGARCTSAEVLSVGAAEQIEYVSRVPILGDSAKDSVGEFFVANAVLDGGGDPVGDGHAVLFRALGRSVDQWLRKLDWRGSMTFEIEALGGGNGFTPRLMETDDALVVPASNGESAVWAYLKGIEICGTAGSSAHDLGLLPMIPLP
jgi:hypothetical protein